MQWLTYFALYFVIWWTVLFVVLPFGVRGQHEDGVVVDGTEPGAPVNPFTLQKMIATSVLAFVVMLLVLWGLSNEWLQAYWS